jgi:EmrB/QacA subfamily drug resistance transporter
VLVHHAFAARQSYAYRMTHPPSTISASAGLSTRQKLLLALILTGQFMAVLDASIVNVAIPTIRRDLGASGAELQLIVASYVIAYAVLLITGARLGQRFGFRRTFLWGLAIFTVASLACGLAPSSQILIVVRAIQGGGAALMVPQVFSLIQRSFSGPGRAQALSLWAATLALGGLVGQVLGGLLVTADILGTGWRPVFLVNVPIGIVLLIASFRLLPIDHPDRARPLDLAGLLSLAAAVLLLVVPLVLGHEEGWPAWTFASLVASVVAIGAFGLIERMVERRGGAPLIAERVLRAPGLPAALVAIVLALASYGGFLFVFTQHLQIGLGDSALVAGLTFVPMAIGFALSSLNWRRLPRSWHERVIPTGCVIAAFGYAGVGLSVGGGGTGGLVLPLALFVAGFGQGMAASPILTVALSNVAPQDAADASGVLTTVIQLGLVLGVATFGSIYLTQAAVAAPNASASAIALTIGLIVIAVVCCAGAAVAMVRAQRSRRPIAAAEAGEVSLPVDAG